MQVAAGGAAGRPHPADRPAGEDPLPSPDREAPQMTIPRLYPASVIDDGADPAAGHPPGALNPTRLRRDDPRITEVCQVDPSVKAQPAVQRISPPSEEGCHRSVGGHPKSKPRRSRLRREGGERIGDRYMFFFMKDAREVMFVDSNIGEQIVRREKQNHQDCGGHPRHKAF